MMPDTLADGAAQAAADGGGQLRAVDAHFHTWDPEHYPWLKDAAQAGDRPGFLNFAPVCRTYTNADHLQDLGASGLRVAKGVYVQAKWPGGDPAAESRHLQAAADKDARGMPQGIIGYADLDKPELAAKQIRDHLRVPNFRGIRFMLDWSNRWPGLRQTSRDGWMGDAGFLAGMAGMAAAREGLVFDLQVCQGQLREAAEMVRKFPSLTFSLNHAGFPLGGGRDGALLAEWQEGMAALAGAPNAYCKIGALCNYDAALGFGPWTEDAVHLYTKKCVELFGPERCMYESNLPVDDLVGNPSERARAFVAALGHLTIDERDMVLAGTAEKVYRI